MLIQNLDIHCTKFEMYYFLFKKYVILMVHLISHGLHDEPCKIKIYYYYYFYYLLLQEKINNINGIIHY